MSGTVRQSGSTPQASSAPRRQQLQHHTRDCRSAARYEAGSNTGSVIAARRHTGRETDSNEPTVTDTDCQWLVHTSCLVTANSDPQRTIARSQRYSLCARERSGERNSTVGVATRTSCRACVAWSAHHHCASTRARSHHMKRTTRLPFQTRTHFCAHTSSHQH